VIALYLDENVEGQVLRALRGRGLDVLSVEEDGLGAAPDPQVLDRATALGRVVFSRDRDFLREAARRQRAGEHFAGVVYAHKSRVTIGRCIEDLELLARVGEPGDFASTVHFLPI